MIIFLKTTTKSLEKVKSYVGKILEVIKLQNVSTA